MKTNKFKIKTTLTIIVACLLSATAWTQQSIIEKFNLPLFDCEQKTIMAIVESKKVTIVVPNDSLVSWNDAKRYEGNCIRMEIDAKVKTESQLLKTDFENNLWILGTIADFANWERFGIPVEKLSNGFKMGELSFTDSSHGFSYVTPHETFPLRIVFSGNTPDAYRQIANMPPIGFEFVVMNNAVPEIIANGSHIVDMNALREVLYTLKESRYYTFMLSKNLTDEDLEEVNDLNIERFDNHVEAFVKKMELNLPESKIKTYIHATQEEIKLFSGFFGALCGGTVHGFVTGNEIHSWKMGGAIEHEANHHLFRQAENKAFNTFLSEGVQKWYEYTVNDEYKARGFEKAREFADEDLTDVICNRINFFQGDKYYLISGIFIDYLIVTYGLNKFKELCKYETFNILQGFENTYSKPLSEILADYKNWLLP